MKSGDVSDDTFLRKVVYLGPGLSGKATNLAYLHASAPARARSKLAWWVPFQGGSLCSFAIELVEPVPPSWIVTRYQLRAAVGSILHDGQRRLLLEGADGIVFVADSQPDRLDANLGSIERLEALLGEKGLSLATVPYVLQLNKRDYEHALPVEELVRQLVRGGEPVIEAIAPLGIGVLETFEAVIEQIRRAPGLPGMTGD